MDQAKPTLGQVVGRNVRRWRLERGQTQDDLSFLLRVGGVDWSRSNVAALESGRHQDVGWGTVIALARALNVRLEALVEGEGDVVLDPKLPISITRAELIRIVHGAKPERYSPEGQQARLARDDLEADAARRLGTTVDRIRKIADRLYRQSLADERAARLPKGLDNTVSARRGYRGRITRQLLAELKDANEVLKEEAE